MSDQQHLLRPDQTLSWLWRDGSMVDPSSASDADLDAAREQLATIEDTAAADLAEARRFVRDLDAPAPGDSLPAVLAEVARRRG